MNTDGSGYTLLKQFSALVSGNNSDGARPFAGLALSGSTLYGTTEYGGTSAKGRCSSSTPTPAVSPY